MALTLVPSAPEVQKAAEDVFEAFVRLRLDSPLAFQSLLLKLQRLVNQRLSGNAQVAWEHSRDLLSVPPELAPLVLEEIRRLSRLIPPLATPEDAARRLAGKVPGEDE